MNIQISNMPPAPVTIAWRCYGNGRLALLLECENGEPFTNATVNLPDEPLAPDEIAVHDYGEHTGVVDFLVENGIAQPPHRYVPSGYVLVPICRLIDRPSQEPADATA
jgi:hypothetical protein